MTLAFVMRKGGKTPWDIFVLLQKPHTQTHTHACPRTHKHTHKQTQTHKPQYQTLIYIHITQESEDAAKAQKRENVFALVL